MLKSAISTAVASPLAAFISTSTPIVLFPGRATATLLSALSDFIAVGLLTPPKLNCEVVDINTTSSPAEKPVSDVRLAPDVISYVAAFASETANNADAIGIIVLFIIIVCN